MGGLEGHEVTVPHLCKVGLVSIMARRELWLIFPTVVMVCAVKYTESTMPHPVDEA